MTALHLRRHSAWLLWGWFAVGIATLAGCSTPGYKSLSTGAPISENPRDYYDLGDQARLTLADGTEIVGEVVQLRTDSITLDHTEIPWSQVVLAERSRSNDVAPWRTASFLLITGAVMVIVVGMLVLNNTEIGSD